MRTSIAPTRASMLLLVLFAGVAMVMAAVGVFGVMSYAVNLRAREMGIRMALGARPAEVRRMVVVDGMKQALVGVVLGLARRAVADAADDDPAVRRHARRSAHAGQRRRLLLARPRSPATCRPAGRPESIR